ncbi:Ras-related protein Rab [Acrasis kona]|uniref:Ras-related protein Rab n=1 Tax=Acrasis kona TaxID=1008807 RepID=A0AAW2YHU0_9EUKA
MSFDDRFDFLYKMILVGDSGVGKTNILTRYCKDEFNLENRSTIGAEFATKISDIDQKKIKIQLWDTAGQERYRSITVPFYRGAVGALVVYDVTKRSTFENVKRWLKDVKEHADENVVAIIVGNKIDLAQARIVSTEEGKELAERQGVAFIETSALSATNIEEAFRSVVGDILLRTPSTDTMGDNPGLDFDQVADLASSNNRQKGGGCSC